MSVYLQAILLYSRLGEIMNLPTWMPKPLFISLIVVGGIIALWIIALITTIIFALIFNSKLNKSSKAINLLLAQRREIMTDLITLCKKHKVKVEDNDIKAINLLERIHDFQVLDKVDRDYRVLTFTHSSHNILSLCEHSSKIKEDEIYADKLIEFNDIEESYRIKSAQYNADILGYNYWISAFSVKWVYRLFGKRKRDLIV